MTTTVYEIGLHTFTTGRDSGYATVVRGSRLTFEDSFTAGLEAARLNEGEKPVCIDAGLRGGTGEMGLPYFVRPVEVLDAEGYRQHRSAIVQAEADRLKVAEKAERKARREQRDRRVALERQAAALRGEV